MEPISGACSGAVYPAAAAGGVKEADRFRLPQEESRPSKPVMDEYIPGEKQESPGLYWLGKDEDGSPKIFFDDPEEPDIPEKKDPDGKAERCTASTDKVDREIERLKRKRDELEEQINRETDPARAEKLEKDLAQVERELRQKDNDAYRRQHTVFS